MKTIRYFFGAVVFGLLMFLTACGSSPTQQAFTPVRLESSAAPAIQEPVTANEYLHSGAENYTKGNYDQAIEHFTKAIELNPGDAEAYVNRGSAYASKQNQTQSLADYNKALEINPDFAEAYTGRGAISYMQKDYEKAVEDFTLAIDHKPDFAGAYFNRGLAYNDMKEKDKAIADFKKVLELDSQSYWGQQSSLKLQELEK
jgi:tetratricopeptide (TPR) repeat protein